jgi:hypothetical protein
MQKFHEFFFIFVKMKMFCNFFAKYENENFRFNSASVEVPIFFCSTVLNLDYQTSNILLLNLKAMHAAMQFFCCICWTSHRLLKCFMVNYRNIRLGPLDQIFWGYQAIRNIDQQTVEWGILLDYRISNSKSPTIWLSDSGY